MMHPYWTPPLKTENIPTSITNIHHDCHDEIGYNHSLTHSLNSSARARGNRGREREMEDGMGCAATHRISMYIAEYSESHCHVRREICRCTE
jgi:hypothetical protein